MSHQNPHNDPENEHKESPLARALDNKKGKVNSPNKKRVSKDFGGLDRDIDRLRKLMNSPYKSSK